MSKQTTPNLHEQEVKTEGENLSNPNLEDANKGTEPDYKVKFSESSREAQRLLEEKKRLLKEKEELQARLDKKNNQDGDEPLFEGFQSLPEEDQRNMIEYTKSIKESVMNDVVNNPVFLDAQKRQNELKWDQAFASVSTAFPDITEHKSEFKSKYYNQDNVPDNIDVILLDLTKSFLFDKAQEIGMRKAQEMQGRVEIPHSQSGSGGQEEETSTHKTLEEWNTLMKTDQKEFLRLQDQFNEDMASGKL